MPQRNHADHNFETVQNDIQLGDLRFRTLLGREEWDNLPKAVRMRFSKRMRHGESTAYRGYVVDTKLSKIGFPLAHALRPLSAPLPLEAGNKNTAAIVSITEDNQGQGQFWTREYAKLKGFPQIIQSSKKISDPTGLEEYIGYGIGMTLRIRTHDDALIFYSDRYYLKFLNHRVLIPRGLCPGQLSVTHADRGEGWFEFTLTLTHKYLGRLVNQLAMFRDERV